MSVTQPLILFCDGTWCGRETDTRTNIYRLAKLVGIEIDDPTTTDVFTLAGKAWYMHGVGLGKTFLDYILNGITGDDISDQCISAYEFIVHNYTYPSHEIWLFGLSRGAYMVRAVAGMINNCGIVRPVRNSDGSVNAEQTTMLCRQVYKIYRSKDPVNEPHSPQSTLFRDRASWPLIGDERRGQPRRKPPVRFIGAIDTVGSLGIPEFVGGIGLDYPRFHNQEVSSVVETFYHAVSIHDRFYIFPPCLGSRKPVTGLPPNYGITQQWFPGVHYDLGRQKFRFLRMLGGSTIERFLARWDWASREIQPNEVLSDLVLRGVLRAIRDNDPTGQVIRASTVSQTITSMEEEMTQATLEERQIGSGDVYANVLEYVPFGRVLVWSLNKFWGMRWQTNQLYHLFFALRDRTVNDLTDPVYDYTVADPYITGASGRSVQELAGVNSNRYPSQTFQLFELCRLVIGLSIPGGPGGGPGGGPAGEAAGRPTGDSTEE